MERITRKELEKGNPKWWDKAGDSSVPCNSSHTLSHCSAAASGNRPQGPPASQSRGPGGQAPESVLLTPELCCLLSRRMQSVGFADTAGTVPSALPSGVPIHLP